MARKPNSNDTPAPRKPDSAPPAQDDGGYIGGSILIDGVDLEELLKSRQKVQAKAWLLYGYEDKSARRPTFPAKARPKRSGMVSELSR
jgi:hypothetical protein